jgi:hypothetical protein
MFYGCRPEAFFVLEVIKQVRGALLKRILRLMRTPASHKLGQHELQHLLDAGPHNLANLLPFPGRGLRPGTLHDPLLHKRFHMIGQLSHPGCIAILRELPEANEDRDATTHRAM